MFFILSKSVAFLLLPSNFLITLGLAGVLLMATRWRRAGVRMAGTSLVLLAIFSLLLIGVCSFVRSKIASRSGTHTVARRAEL